MALTVNQQLAHKSAGGEIRYKITGLSTPDGNVTEQVIKSFSLVENMHAEITGQLDMRLAGRYNALPWSNYGYPTIEFTADYINGGGTVIHTEPLGTYYVHESAYDEIADEHVVRAFTKETFLRDSKFNLDDLSTSSFAGETCDQLIRRYIGYALPFYMVNGFLDYASVSGKSVPIDQLRGLQGTSRLTAIDNLISPYDARISSNRRNEFIVTTRAAKGSVIQSRYFTAGDNRLVKNLSINTDREQWYNAVSLKYWWSNGDTTVVTNAYARVRATTLLGDVQPMAPETSGEKIFHKEINGGMSQSAANTAARLMLDSLLRRGEQLIITAVLVPGVQTGQYFTYDGRQWLIARTNLDFTADTMTLECELLTHGQTIESYTPTER